MHVTWLHANRLESWQYISSPAMLVKEVNWYFNKRATVMITFMIESGDIGREKKKLVGIIWLGALLSHHTKWFPSYRRILYHGIWLRGTSVSDHHRFCNPKVATNSLGKFANKNREHGAREVRRWWGTSVFLLSWLWHCEASSQPRQASTGYIVTVCACENVAVPQWQRHGKLRVRWERTRRWVADDTGRAEWDSSIRAIISFSFHQRS